MRAVYRIVLRTQLTKGRLLALAAVAAVGLLVAFAIRQTPGAGPADARGLVDSFGLGLLVPIVSLVFASAALGDPVEDRTLVYLWLRPVRRWQLALASYAAALTIVVPLAVLPVMAMALVARGGSSVVTAVGAAAAVAVIAYVALFLGLGFVVRRALAWGLTYVLIWEGFVARSGTSAARLSVLSYARSLLARMADAELPRLAASTGASVAVPLLIAAVALLLTTRALASADVA